MPANPRHSNQPATFDPAPRRRKMSRPERRPGARSVIAGLALALAAAVLTAVPAQPAAAANAGVGVLPNDVALTPGDGSFTLTWGDWDDRTVIGLSRIAWRVKDTDTTMAGDQPGSWMSDGISNQRRFATSDEITAKSLTISSQLTNDVTYEVEAAFSWQFHGTTTGVLKVGEVTPTAGGSTPTTTVAATPPTTLTLTTDAASDTVAEGGGSVTVTATLDEAATAAVSVTLSAGAASTAAATDYTLPAAFTIAMGDTSATGTVQITDDDIDEDSETVVLTATAGSLSVTPVTLTITDDDTRGVTVSQSARTVAAGATTTYTVVLDSQPTASVTITPTSGTVAAATVSGALTFTTSNWSVPKTVTVTGVAEGTATVTHAVTASTDPKYPTTLSIASVAVTVSVASDDASLSALTGEVSTDGSTFSGSLDLIPDFDAETTSYSASVANGVTHVRVTPTVNDSGASAEVALRSFDETVASGSASSALTLNVGLNTVTVIVTASDGTEQIYFLRVTRRTALAANSIRVVSVAPGDGVLDVVWERSSGVQFNNVRWRLKDKYRDVSGAQPGLVANEELNGWKYSIASNLLLGRDLSSYEITGLLNGHVYEVQVRGVYGPTDARVLTGWVGVEATPVGDVDSAVALSALSGSTSTDNSDFSGSLVLTPVFDGDTTVYYARPAANVSHVKFTPTVATSGATVRVGPKDGTLAAVTSGSASASLALSGRTGFDVFTVRVTAADGNSSQDYTVEVLRSAAPSNVSVTASALNGAPAVTVTADGPGRSDYRVYWQVKLPSESWSSRTGGHLVSAGAGGGAVGLDAQSRLQLGDLVAGTELDVRATYADETGSILSTAFTVPGSESAAVQVTTFEKPAVPSSVAVAPKTAADDELTVSWTAPAAVTPAVSGYLLRWRVRDANANQSGNQPGSWNDNDGVSVTGTSRLITGLSTATAYDVQVRATNGVHSDWSAVASGATAPVAPTFTVAGGDTKLTVSYDASSISGRGAVVPTARWRIKDTDANMAGNQAGAWLPTANGNGQTYVGSSFDIPGATCTGTGCGALTNGTVYEVQVDLAYVGYSSGWQAAGDGTPAAPAAPAALTGLMVVEADGALNLSWTEPEDTVTGYDVHYTSALSTGNDAVANEDAASGSEPSDAWVDTANTFTSAFFTIDSLDNGTTYRVRVRAKNSGGSGAWVFGSGEPEIVLQWLVNPAAAQVIEGENFDVEAHLSNTAGFTDAISAGLTYAAGSSNPASLADDLPSGYATTITSTANQLVKLTLPRPVDDAVNEQHETFTVTLNAGTGYTLGARDVLTVTIVDNDAPTAPSGLSLTAGDTKLTASWSKPAGPVTGYQVRYKEASASDQAASTPGDPSTGWVTNTPAGTGTTAEITSLTNGTDYHVQVRATDGQTETGNGYGDWTASETGTPAAATAPGVTLSTNTVSVAEGATAQYTAVLDTQPSAQVVVTATSGTATKATVSGALTFTTSNWDTAQPFTVTGVDAGTSAITHAATSTDTDYSIPTVGTVTATVTATATPPSTVTLTTNAASNTVAEGGGSVTVTATLDEAATSAVSATLTATGTAGSGDYTLPSAFTIAQGQTMATGSVQITDDDLDEDNETIILSASGTGLTVTGVTLTITDNDTAGITLSTNTVSVAEGATGTYTVVLDSQPTASVTVTPTSGTTSKATVAPSSRMFTTSNWNVAQSFTVTGVDAGTSAITHAATSTDTDYSIPTVGTVTATVTATATPPSTVTLTTNAASNTVAEGGGSVTVTATLDEAATSAVSVTLTATGTAGSGDYTLPSAFTIAQGQSTGTGTVQITDDDLDEDNETIILSASGTGLTVTGVTLTITDNDTAGVTLSQTARSVEVGATNTYTVVLDSQPTASVTVTPTSASTDKATVTPASVTFTTANWKTPKTFTVTGVAVGTSAITHAATSSDTDYSIGTVGTVTATVGASTKTFRIESTKTVAEGSTASLTVTLGQAAPTGGLSLSVAYSYSGSSAGSSADLGASPPSSVTVSPGSTTATLRVPTNNDSLVEGDETFTVTLSTSVSGWAGTSGETAATVTVTDDDDDNARIGFGTSGRTTAYTRNVAEDVSGGVLNVPIQVSRLPQASTTVTVEVRTGGTATEYQSAQAPGDFRIATKSVTFTATGNRTQNLAVTITDDMLVEDDQTILLRIANSGSSGMDSHYSRHASGRLATVTIADDDDDDARVAFGASATATAPHTGSVDEDVSGGSLSVPVTINRRPETSTEFSVQVVAQGANRASEYVSAQNPGDFQIATKSVTFGPTGALSKNLTVSVTDDDWVEEDQTIVLRIVDSPASGANSLGRHYSRHNAAKTAILTITDDDADDAKIAIPNSPSFSFDTDFGMRLSDLNLVEGSNVGVPVRVSHLPETSTVFNLSVLSAGTNESSSEYSIVTMSVTFGPSTAKEQSMNVVSVNDDLVENDKTIAVRLDDSPASGANKLGRHYTRNAQSRQATLNVDDVDDQVAAKIAFHASNASSTTAYTASVDEDDGTVDVPVTVSLLPESSTTFTVEVLETATRPATEYTNAQNPGDYRVLGNKQVSFASSGAKTRNVRVQLNNNALVEHPETVQLRIVAADSPVDDLGDYYDRHASSRSATLTVADDDAAAARIAIGSSASSTAKYTVSRSEDHSQMGLVIPIRVSHAPSEATTFALEVLAASTATENTDYSMPLKTIIFTPSGLSDNVPVRFTDDDWVEHDQTIEVRIAAADATVDDLGDYYTRDTAGATGTVTIEDDEQREAKVAFGTAARTSAYTANGEEVVGTLTVPVAINHLPESNTTFTVEVLDSSTARETDDPTNATGNPKDFGIAAKTVTFGAATAKTMNITIAIANDVVEEDDEEIRLRVVAADATVDDLGDHYDRHSSGSTARVTVKSEDQVSKVTLSTTAPPGPRNNLYAVHEGTAMTVTATADIPVGPGGWRVTPRMRPYGSLPGFASAADVRFASFVIPEGQTSATGKITFVQDNTAEPQEQLIVQGSARRRTRTLQTALSGLVAAGGLRVQISDGGAGATVSTTSLEIVEAEAATYEISLNAAPTADVVVTPASSASSRATVSGALTFTTSNWQTPQPVTVTGAGDGTATISHTVTSADLTYNGLTTVLDVAVKVLEPAKTFSLAVKETGARSGIGTEGTPIELEITLGDLAPTGGLEFTVTQLAAQGTTPTTVTVAEGERRVSFDAGIADDTTAQVTLRVRSVTVTTAVSGWNAKTADAGDVSLSFEDDDGGEATVAFGASATPTGAHLVTVAENVSAGTVEVPVTISGGGSTDITFNVAVLSDSTATVRSTCDVAGADFAIADRTITFASTDGLTKNLTVTICDDDAVEPDETIRLGFAPARSPARTVADLYARRPAGNLQAVITIDSEDAPTTVSLRAGAGGVQHATGNVREGSSVTITATLDKPADVGGVAIALRVASGVGNTAGAAEYTLPASFIIPAGQTSATAQVRLLDDDEVDGLKYLRLTATTTPALTLVWAQPAAPYMDISISDTDSPGITASDTSPTVAQGQSAPYTIRLNTRPSANVTVAVAVDDTAIATVAPVTLTFTPNNFRDPQTVRIRGRQTGATTITHTATSTDTNYNTTLTAQLTVTTPTTTTTTTITGGPTTTITGGPTGGPPVGGDPTDEDPADEDPADEDPADEDPDRRFADVDPAGVHSADIEALAAAGITAGCGTEPVRYCPDRAVTRAQMATFLVRALDLQPPEEPAGFADTDPAGVHSADIEALAAAGITAGCGTEPVRYCPDRAVTRAQMATFLVRALDLQPPEEPAGFADVDPAGVHSADIEALAAAGITAGCGTDPLRYCPDSPVTRAQMATFLVRALDLQPPQDPES